MLSYTSSAKNVKFRCVWAHLHSAFKVIKEMTFNKIQVGHVEDPRKQKLTFFWWVAAPEEVLFPASAGFNAQGPDDSGQQQDFAFVVERTIFMANG
jgi:hypothetical protein